MKVGEHSIFSMVMCVIIGTFVVLSFRLSAISKTVPLLVGIPVLTLAIIQLMSDLMPHFGEKIRKYGGESLLRNIKENGSDQVTQISPRISRNSLERTGDIGMRKKELEMLGWTLSLFVFIYFLGYLIAIPLFTMPFLTIHAKARWGKALGMTTILTGAIYALFVSFLQTPLWKGLLLGGMGF